MLPTDSMPLAAAAVAAAACLVLVLMAMRLVRRRRGVAGSAQASAPQRPEGQALLERYHPSAVRVLTVSERGVFDLVREALPGHFVMAQVPLVRYLRVQDKRVEDDWLRGLSMLSADILVCDTTSRPLLAIDILGPKVGTRARERHERMRQLLEGVGIRVLVWHEGRLPAAAQVREQLRSAIQSADGSPRTPARRESDAGTARPRVKAESPRVASVERIEPELGTLDPPEQVDPADRTAVGAQAPVAPEGRRGAQASRTAAMPPLIPVPEISELLAEGDEIAARHPSLDPVSLTFFDEFEPRPYSHSTQQVH